MIGYIREIQAIFPSDNTFYIIPELVQYKCLKFYNNPERFINCGSKIKMNEKGTEIVMTKPSCKMSAIGSIEIAGDSKSIYIWKFYIFNDEYVIRIGITSAADVDVEKGITDQTDGNNFYLFSNGGYRYDLQHREPDDHVSTGFHLNKYVQMLVNPSKKMIRYIVNNDEDGQKIFDDVTFNNIDFENKKYRMAVEIGWVNSGVRLIDFTRELPSHGNIEQT